MSASLDGIFSLDKIRSDPSPNLWVFNNTPKLNNRFKNSVVHMVVSTGGSGTDKVVVRVPPTWVPINIGMQAPKRAIFDSPEFLRSVNNNFIRLISNEDAKQFFSADPDAQAEFDSQMNKLNNTAPDRTNTPDPVKNLENMDLTDGQIEDADINPKVIVAVGRVNDNSLTTAEFTSMLRSQEGDLTRKDYDYILAQVKDQKVHAFVNKAIRG